MALREVLLTVLSHKSMTGYEIAKTFDRAQHRIEAAADSRPPAKGDDGRGHI